MSSNLNKLTFVDNSSIRGTNGKYTTVEVDIAKVLKSWKGSLFAFEWLNPDGSIKGIDDLPLSQREKRLEVESLLGSHKPLEKPVLGIGLLDTVEIGAGKPVFITLGARGIKSIPVHIPVSNEKDFAKFRY